MPQQAIMELALMERVEKTNVVVVRGAGQGQGAGIPPRQNPYAMEVDQRKNCYACRGFEHMACHCRNKERGRPMEERRMEYGGERIEKIYDQKDNLKGMENLELLD